MRQSVFYDKLIIKIISEQSDDKKPFFSLFFLFTNAFIINISIILKSFKKQFSFRFVDWVVIGNALLLLLYFSSFYWTNNPSKFFQKKKTYYNTSASCDLYGIRLFRSLYCCWYDWFETYGLNWKTTPIEETIFLYRITGIKSEIFFRNILS